MRSLLTLALLVAALPVWGAVYKWVDESGKVHYSDQPPPTQGAKKAETIRTPKPAPATPAAAPGSEAGKAAPKSAAEQEMEFRKRRMEATEAEAKRQKEAQESEEKRRNCAQARNRVAALEGGGRAARYGPDGELQYLSDEEIARELGDARKIADSWCK
jgi:hypothetical protein